MYGCMHVIIKHDSLRKSCKWFLKTLLSFNIKTHYGMSLYMEESIGHIFENIP
jgi:hypothetical protein